jgi:uncharacterized membrane protein
MGSPQSVFTVPELPSERTTLFLPTPYRQWTTFGAPRALLILALVPVAVGLCLASMMLLFAVSPCAEADSCEYVAGGALLAVLSLIGIVGLLCAASLIAPRVVGRAAGERSARWQERVQAAKDAYVRGELDDAAYQRLRQVLKPASEGRAPAEDARRASTMLRIFVVPLAVMAGLFLPLNLLLISDLVHQDSLLPLFIGFLVVDAMVTWLLVTGVRTLVSMRRLADELDQRFEQRVEALELGPRTQAKDRPTGPRSRPAGR